MCKRHRAATRWLYSDGHYLTPGSGRLSGEVVERSAPQPPHTLPQFLVARMRVHDGRQRTHVPRESLGDESLQHHKFSCFDQISCLQAIEVQPTCSSLRRPRLLAAPSLSNVIHQRLYLLPPNVVDLERYPPSLGKLERNRRRPAEWVRMIGKEPELLVVQLSLRGNRTTHSPEGNDLRDKLLIVDFPDVEVPDGFASRDFTVIHFGGKTGSRR